jgi:hypothetical protein
MRRAVMAKVCGSGARSLKSGGEREAEGRIARSPHAPGLLEKAAGSARADA